MLIWNVSMSKQSACSKFYKYDCISKYTGHAVYRILKFYHLITKHCYNLFPFFFVLQKYEYDASRVDPRLHTEFEPFLLAWNYVSVCSWVKGKHFPATPIPMNNSQGSQFLKRGNFLKAIIYWQFKLSDSAVS